MIISVNWLKELTEIDGTIDDLTTLIGSRLVEIENVVELGKKYEGVIVAKVVECSAVEGSDHLNVTKIDDGGAATDVERDEHGLVQVVCGAPNVRAGMFVAWLPPHSTVPETYNDKEPFVLGARKLRGVMSNGMLASAKELDLFDEHDGILEIDTQDVRPGASFAQTFELNDQLLDIENKSLTHRPDTFGVIGFAREVAAIQGKAFKTPENFAHMTPEYGEKQGDVATPNVTIDNPELCARYQAVVMGNIDANAKSGLALQTYLARVGVRPISAVVDTTNYLMMLTGQPLHAFDYDKLKVVGGGNIDIHVRAGVNGETLELLDGRTIELSDNDIVIANGNTPVALAGAMGGANTEIDSTTTTILLESATFNLYNLRNTQMRHGIFSEAITRFTKGQPAALTAPVLAAAINGMSAWSGGKRLSDVADAYPDHIEQPAITVAVATINQTLGTKFAVADVVDTLQNVEFTVRVSEDTTTITATPPYWRSDIHIAEDIIEEVGRLNGFDAIEPTLPVRDFTAVSPDDFDQLRVTIRRTLSRAGANEVLTYSFVHGDLLQKAGQQPDNSYRITNSISPDLQYYRQTLTPSLLNLVHQNIKNGFDTFALYELNKTHAKNDGLNDDGVPQETDSLALTVVDKNNAGSAYYAAKSLLEYTAKTLHITLKYQVIDQHDTAIKDTPFEYRRSAIVKDAASGTVIGIVGEYKHSVTTSFKLPKFAAGFEIDPRALLQVAAENTTDYTPISRYPSTERDICFQVNTGVTYEQIIDAAQIALDETNLEYTLNPLDIYQQMDDATKNITIRIRLTSHEKTLASDDATAVMSAVIDAVSSATHAMVV
jgi:phenylalanyl-tRNA synthetase beta chain